MRRRSSKLWGIPAFFVVILPYVFHQGLGLPLWWALLVLPVELWCVYKAADALLD